MRQHIELEHEDVMEALASYIACQYGFHHVDPEKLALRATNRSDPGPLRVEVEYEENR